MSNFSATLKPQYFHATVAAGQPGPAGPPGPSITVQNVVTGSRAANTVYQNTTGKALWICTSWNMSGSGSAMSLLSDASNPPVTEVARIANASPQADTEQMFAIVL